MAARTPNESSTGRVTTMRRAQPSLGQMDEFLREMGFTHRRYEYNGVPRHRYVKEASGCQIDFRDRPRDKPLPDYEVVSAHTHLTWNGLIGDVPLDQFLDQFAPAKAG